jgi:signal transduction histidine kinase
MKGSQIYEKEIVAIILYTSLFFILLAVGLIVFFYFSRKRIIKKELEKKDLEIQFKQDQIQAVILTQEEERKRIAQDLHDDISSKLNVVALNSHLLNSPNLTVNEVQEITQNIIELTGKALDSSRKIAHGLLPPVLEKFGLHAGVEELCLEFSTSKAVNVNYSSRTAFNIAENGRHLHVFRILQELMNNSLRHGKATKIAILFEEIENRKQCTYTDNGIGFVIDSSDNMKGLGMKNIESRIAFLKGAMDVKSAPNEGVTIIFNFD